MAKILGLSSNLSKSTPTVRSDIEQTATTPDQDEAHSPWPDLFRALRQHAQANWVARSQRHANINPDERLAITSLKVQATSLEMQKQLDQWFSESNVPYLIQWMVRGPFKTDTIERWVILDSLQQLQVIPMLQPINNFSSPYEAVAPEIETMPAGFEIESDTEWQPKKEKSTQVGDLPPLELIIQDEMGERRTHLRHTLVILGAEKVLKKTGGQTITLKDQSPFDWQGETAWFVSVKAKYVSGIHLVLRLRPGGVDCLDGGSTNGTYVNGQKLNAGNWHEVQFVETLFLGGPASDPRSHSAKIELRIGHPVMALAKDRTPLRVETPEVNRPILITLGVTNIPSMSPVQVHALPFTIGRNASSNWVITPEHGMVSRKHLVVEAIDVPRRKIKIRDVSQHGLTQSRNGWKGEVDKGVWISWDDEVTIGKISHHSGITICFSSSL